MRTAHPSQQLSFLFIADDSNKTSNLGHNVKSVSDKPWKLSHIDKRIGLAGIESVRSALAKSTPLSGEILAKAS